MNTPAHVLLGLCAVGRGPEAWRHVVAGSLLPDLPMFLFYLVERFGYGRPEAAIWREAYFEPSWQFFFDLFNSLPLIVGGWVIARFWGAAGLQLFFASMALHCGVDLLVHHDDAHRHFLPMASWRFQSPVSYWDPDHHGLIFAPLEATFVGIASIVMLRRSEPRPVRRIGGITLALYVAFLIFGLVFWAGGMYGEAAAAG